MAYETQPGTIPHKIYVHLQALGPGAEISCQEAAILVGWESASGLRTALRPACKGGLLAVRVVSARDSRYSLGGGFEEPEEADEQVRTVSAEAASSIFAYAEQRNAADFSTAVSSDGRLILQRKGRVIAELTPDEARVHREFLGKRQQWEMAE